MLSLTRRDTTLGEKLAHINVDRASREREIDKDMPICISFSSKMMLRRRLINDTGESRRRKWQRRHTVN